MVCSSLLGQDRFARVAWSRLAEPADAAATKLVGALGHVGALRRVLDAVAAGAHAGDGPARPLRGPDASDVAAFLLRGARLDVERDLEVGARFGARVVCPGDEEWPSGLDSLEQPPHCLWVRGPVPLGPGTARSVSVVGARSCTPYGDLVASGLGAGLADRGWTVVSGAAFGIDAAAHRGALSVGGETVAVLAGGVERPYPLAHRDLIERIAATGAVVSEVAPGSAPTRNRFLARNRLIATMTRGTVIVEAGLRSGSLNTARWAGEHGRPIGVVPGPVTSMMSAGCHQALRDGYATVVTDVAEVIDLVGGMGVDAAPRPSDPPQDVDRLDPECRRVLGALPIRKAVSAVVVALGAGLPEATALAALNRLEMLGFAERDGGHWRQVAPSRRG